MLYNIIKNVEFNPLYKLMPNGVYTFTLPKKLSFKYNYKVRVKGEVGIPYTNRTEGVFPRYYRKLEDSIRQDKDGKTLLFGEFNSAYERSCYYMIRGLKKGEYEFSYEYKATDVKSDIVVSLEAYYGKEKTRYYYEEADDVFTYPVESTNGETVIKKQAVSFKKDADFVMLKISALGFNGEAEFKAPKLVSGDKNFIEDFEYDVDRLEDIKWMGEGFNLSERPSFSVKVNGKEIFYGKMRDKLSRLSGVEFAIPEGTLSGGDKVEIKLNGINRYSYDISNVQLITTPKEFEILGYNTLQREGEKSGLLVYLPTEGKVKVNCSGADFGDSVNLESGVNVLSFIPRKQGKVSGSVEFNGKKIGFSFNVFSKKKHILTGTGDFIYIHQNLTDFTEYLAWYLNNNVGNMMTLRSVYRWSVTSECNVEFWGKAVKLLCGLGIYYSLMIDGRELNGINACPTKDLLESEYFLGEQTHERDGAYLYWEQPLKGTDDFLYHILSKKTKRTGISGRQSPVYDSKGNAYWYYNTENVRTMKDGYEQIYSNIKKTLNEGAVRHTGVTPFFHTFLDAGYKWVGYESMYGPHELLLGAVRGMSKSKGIDKFGTHLALQWSTSPSDNIYHALRYRLSLYLSYMHGATEVNTEEGLWMIETPFVGHDRFSYACKIHQKEQEDFYKFVLTHERKGKLKTDIAMILGSYDGFDCFSKGTVYGKDEWEYDAPEKSWDLLKVFYPQADLNSIYYFIIKGGKANLKDTERDFFKNAIEGYKDVLDLKSVGLYSTTPYGPIDIIASNADNYSDYKFLFFTGYNAITEDQLKKLIDFVKGGGTLLLSKVHLYSSVDREEVLSGKAKVIDSKLVDELLSYKDRVVFIDEDKYPIEIKDYKAKLSELGQKFGSKYITDCDNVSFVEYENGNERIIYLLDINWWNNKKSSCTLNVFGKSKKILLGKNRMKTVVIDLNNKKYEIL